jgi:hypothetical protein
VPSFCRAGTSDDLYLLVLAVEATGVANAATFDGQVKACLAFAACGNWPSSLYQDMVEFNCSHATAKCRR